MSGAPKHLLRAIAWSCGTRRWPDAARFAEAVEAYQRDIIGSTDHWTPDARVLERPRVQVMFECWDGDIQLEVTLDLEAPDGRGFTMLDLFFGICDGIAAHLVEHARALHDHRFFEGIGLGEDRPVPLYHVWFGS